MLRSLVGSEMCIRDRVKQDQNQEEWLENVMEILKEYPVPEHRIIPMKDFRTRKSWTKHTSLCQSLRRTLGYSTFGCFNPLLNNVCKDMTENLRKNPKQWRILPEEWPLIEFEFRQDDPCGDLPTTEAKISEMNIPETLIKVSVNRYVFQGDINEECRNLVRILVKVAQITQINLEFSGSGSVSYTHLTLPTIYSV
eukprot:TRINITY_DN7393_c0_g1_i3.p1 TRINITY_DN7393_c0_g1~~TRINITY_DN7393_c0_g1_i3.p1  ORF type:complete len:196 (+),score=31.63 TRINITY_DN7393_c0_g1_i3:43-630(+)